MKHFLKRPVQIAILGRSGFEAVSVLSELAHFSSGLTSSYSTSVLIVYFVPAITSSPE